MKICQFVASSGSGGLERHVVDLCNALSERHEVTLIAAESFRSQLHKHVAFAPFPARGWRRSPRHLWRLYRILRRAQPDVVHAQASKAAAMVRILKPLLGAQTVATIHNRKRSSRAFDGYDWVIGVSGDVARQISSTRTSVVFNGINPPLPAPSLRATGQPTALAVGRLVPAKGFDILLDAWRHVDAPLAIAGNGPELQGLQARIEEYGLSERVTMLGFRDDIPDLLRSAHLVVITSRREGFPYVLIEALHAQAVVLSTPVPGALDVLPGEAILSDPSPHAIAARINEVLADLPGLQDRFKPVWEFARRELTVSAMAAKTEAVYSQLCQAPRN